MIKIEVKSAEVTTKSGIAAKTGKPYSIREQEAWAFLCSVTGPQPYPSRTVLNLEDDQPPYPPGQYTIDASSIYVGDFGSLRLGRLRLKALAPAAARAA